jgi:hypothetical protein
MDSLFQNFDEILYDAFDNASSKSPHVVIPVGRRLPAEMIELHLSMWILLLCI